MNLAPRLNGCGYNKVDNICITDKASHSDYLTHTCNVFFFSSMCLIVHCMVEGRVLVDYIITPATIAPRANNQKALSSPARGKTARCKHTHCNMGGSHYIASWPLTSFPDSSLIVWLLLFALNVLMFLVGVNGTPESDYLSAPLTNSTFILYFSFLIT